MAKHYRIRWGGLAVGAGVGLLGVFSLGWIIGGSVLRGMVLVGIVASIGLVIAAIAIISTLLEEWP